MTTPVGPSGPGGGSGPAGTGGTGQPFPSLSPSDEVWANFAMKLFGTPDAVLYIAALKRNMMMMINTTISEINARNAKAMEYVKKVAEGEE